MISFRDIFDCFHSHDIILEEKQNKKAAGILVVANDTKKLLLAFRSPKTEQGNRWGIIGGMVENSESFEKAAKRELVEETGYNDIVNINLKLLHIFKDSKFTYNSYLGVVPKQFVPISKPEYTWEMNNLNGLILWSL